MEQSVLNLGEKIVLAARLAAIEHIRQAISEQPGQRLELVGDDEPSGLTDESEPQLGLLIRQRWRDLFEQAQAKGVA